MHFPEHHRQRHPVATVGAAAVQDRGRLDVFSAEAARRAATASQPLLHAGKSFLHISVVRAHPTRAARCERGMTTGIVADGTHLAVEAVATGANTRSHVYDY